MLTAANRRQPPVPDTQTGIHASQPLAADDVTALPAVIVPPAPAVGGLSRGLLAALVSYPSVRNSWKRQELRGGLEVRCGECIQPCLLPGVSPLLAPPAVAFVDITAVIHYINLVSLLYVQYGGRCQNATCYS